VLFADMVDSTGLTTRVDPERARLTLTKYYDVVADEVEVAGGTLEKFVGDAVVAVFGAPIAQEDHAERALHTALAVQRQLKESFGGQLAVRIGVATGEVVIGNARAGGSLATGAAVNVAARLEQSADPGEILVGARTARAAGAAFEFGPTTVIEAKGMPAGIECRSLVRALALTPARRRPPRHGVRRARERI
jgi:class 3 adenylate cyclase